MSLSSSSTSIKQANNLACHICRRLRRKCSMTKPVCHACHELNKECTWPDKRKLPVKTTRRSHPRRTATKLVSSIGLPDSAMEAKTCRPCILTIRNLKLRLKTITTTWNRKLRLKTILTTWNLKLRLKTILTTWTFRTRIWHTFWYPSTFGFLILVL